MNPDQLRKLLDEWSRNPKGVRFSDLMKVCERVFGPARQSGTSHMVFRTPWPGDPRVNIQRGRDGNAKAYQVKQVLAAIEKLEGMKDGKS